MALLGVTLIDSTFALLVEVKILSDLEPDPDTLLGRFGVSKNLKHMIPNLLHVVANDGCVLPNPLRLKRVCFVGGIEHFHPIHVFITKRSRALRHFRVK
jgi:hypothetical protein